MQRSNGKMCLPVLLPQLCFSCSENLRSVSTSEQEILEIRTGRQAPLSSYSCGFIIRQLFFISARLLQNIMRRRGDGEYIQTTTRFGPSTSRKKNQVHSRRLRPLLYNRPFFAFCSRNISTKPIFLDSADTAIAIRFVFVGSVFALRTQLLI